MSVAPEQSPLSEVSSTACPNCEKPDYAANGWCRFCGFYGVLGKCVDVATWEQEYVDGAYIGADSNADEQPWLDAIKSIPAWAWYLLGTLGLVTLINVLVSISTVQGGAYHILAAAALLMAGVLVAVGTHIYAGLRQMKEDEQCTLSDVLLHPIQVWCGVVVQLPYSVKRVTLLWSAVWTVVLVHVIVGVPYFQFIDFASRPQEAVAFLKPGDLVSAAAGASGSDMTMEEALEAFAAEAPENALSTDPSERLTLKDAFNRLAEDLANLPETLDAEPELVTQTLKTVVVAFQTDAETGAISSLVLAVNSNGLWRIAGTMSAGLEPEILAQLQTQVGSITRDQPFIATELRANWVEPILRCQIQADYSETEDRFEALTFLKML